VVIKWFVAAVFVLGLTGCGDSKSKVRGKVTLNNKTVVWGTVTLVDRTGAFHQADIDLNGNYVLENVPTGTVKIAVVSPNPYPPAGRPEGGRGVVKGDKGGEVPGFEDPREKFMAGKAKAESDRPKPQPGAWFPIPPKYNAPDESGLTADVKGKEYELNIDLK
jgi:hypothetical protein